jgi:hypothetical protein
MSSNAQDLNARVERTHGNILKVVAILGVCGFGESRRDARSVCSTAIGCRHCFFRGTTILTADGGREIGRPGGRRFVAYGVRRNTPHPVDRTAFSGSHANRPVHRRRAGVSRKPDQRNDDHALRGTRIERTGEFFHIKLDSHDGIHAEE